MQSIVLETNGQTANVERLTRRAGVDADGEGGDWEGGREGWAGVKGWGDQRGEKYFLDGGLELRFSAKFLAAVFVVVRPIVQRSFYERATLVKGS